MKPTENDLKVLAEVAGKLGVPPDWLFAQINFESGGSWDPKIKNPNSSARGLIQFMNSTALNMGYKDSLDLVEKNPTISSQLRGPVFEYYKQFMPFPNSQSFFLSVFLPKYRNASPDTVIYHDDVTRKKSFQSANPGIKTVGDYTEKLMLKFLKGKKPTIPEAGKIFTKVLFSVAMVAGIFLLIKKIGGSNG